MPRRVLIVWCVAVAGCGDVAPPPPTDPASARKAEADMRAGAAAEGKTQKP